MNIQQKNNLLLNDLMAPQIGNSFSTVGGQTPVGQESVGSLTQGPALPMNNMTTSPGMSSQVAPSPMAAPAEAAPAQSDSDRRQAEIAEAEAIRMKKAQERLALRRQNGSPSSAGPSSGSSLPPQFTGGKPYSIDDLIKPEVAQAQAKIGMNDRKPASEWGRKDWGKMMLSIGQGFGAASGGSFADGLSSASLAAGDNMQRMDADADAFNEKQRLRAETLNDMIMEEDIRHRRSTDEREYDQSVRQQARGERKEDIADERNYGQTIRQQNRADRKEDIVDERGYRRDLTADERAHEEAIRRQGRIERKEDVADERGYRKELTADERNYDGTVRQQNRADRKEDVADQRSYADKEQDEARRLAKEDLADNRKYAETQRDEERKYASEAAAAMNKRADAKEVRDAAKSLSRDYQKDFIDIAKTLNAASIKETGAMLDGETLRNSVMEQIRAAYGLTGALGPASSSAVPTNRPLRSGLE